MSNIKYRNSAWLILIDTSQPIELRETARGIVRANNGQAVLVDTYWRYYQLVSIWELSGERRTFYYITPEGRRDTTYLVGAMLLILLLGTLAGGFLLFLAMIFVTMSIIYWYKK